MAIGRLPHESAEYGTVRDRVQEEERALRDQRERVAAPRRQLPLDTVFDDQVFEEFKDGQRVAVRLSELFDDPAQPLVLMHFMHGKKQAEPCRMCTMWADGYNGVVTHLRRRMNFAVLVAGDIQSFTNYAESRGWVTYDSFRLRSLTSSCAWDSRPRMAASCRACQCSSAKRTVRCGTSIRRAR